MSPDRVPNQDKGEEMKWSEKKNPFNVGDRVLCEDTKGILGIAKVIESYDYTVTIETGDGIDHYVHWRQCKKLKPKKKPREIWVNAYFDGYTAHDTKENADKWGVPDRKECVLFREVLKR